MGLWFDLPSIGCAKTPLLDEFISPEVSKGSYEWIFRGKENVGAVLRTKEKVKPLFISPGHRIDLSTSIQLILESCKGYRFPEPLRKAHQLAERIEHSAIEQHQIPNSQPPPFRKRLYRNPLLSLRGVKRRSNLAVTKRDCHAPRLSNK